MLPVRHRPRGRWLFALLLLACACGRARDRGLPPLRIGTSADYAPFSLGREGDLSGLDIDIARRFARDRGQRVEFIRFRWPALTDDLAAGRFDLAMGGITMRPERAVVGTYTRPIAFTGAVVLVRRGVSARIPDLDRPPMRLGVNGGGHLERITRRLFPHASIIPTRDNLALPWLLETHAADAIVTDDLEADLFVREVGGTSRLGPLTHDRKAYLGTDRALVADLDAWLRARDADGTLAELRTEWLGPKHAGAHTAFASDLEALLALVDLRLAFMPGVAAAKEQAGKAVEDVEQQDTVLAAVRAQATALGLDPNATDAFFRAQIAAARAVQRAYLAMPRDARPRVDPLDLAWQARPAIAALSEQIVARAADVAADPAALARVAPETIADALDASLVPAAQRTAIAAGVKGLRATRDPVSGRER